MDSVSAANYGFGSAAAEGRCLCPVVEQKSLLGNVVYWHPPLLTVEGANPAFQLESLEKHEGVGGVMWVTLVKVDGMVKPKP